METLEFFINTGIFYLPPCTASKPYYQYGFILQKNNYKNAYKKMKKFLRLSLFPFNWKVSLTLSDFVLSILFYLPILDKQKTITQQCESQEIFSYSDTAHHVTALNLKSIPYTLPVNLSQQLCGNQSTFR
ncbi:MAG: hypothetical protein K2J90_06720 [Lachnospiraceae bacterium]|nr:hypothetical protein [Lachnospiraceae bacterium]